MRPTDSLLRGVSETKPVGLLGSRSAPNEVNIKPKRQASSKSPNKSVAFTQQNTGKRNIPTGKRGVLPARKGLLG